MLMENLGSDFDPTGSVVSLQELAAQRKKKGECVQCGQKCFKKKAVFKMVPLDVPGLVENGKCLKCNPLDRVSGSSIAVPSLMTSSNRSTGPPLSFASATSSTKPSPVSIAATRTHHHGTQSPSSSSPMAISTSRKSDGFPPENRGTASRSFPMSGTSSSEFKSANRFPSSIVASPEKSSDPGSMGGHNQKSKQSSLLIRTDDDVGSLASSRLSSLERGTDGFQSRQRPPQTTGGNIKYKFIQDPSFFVPVLLTSMASLIGVLFDEKTIRNSLLVIVVLVPLFGSFAILWNGQLDRKSETARIRSSDQDYVLRMIGEAQTMPYLKSAYRSAAFQQALGRLEDHFRNKNRQEKEEIAKTWAIRMRKASRNELDEDWSLNLDRRLCLEWIKQLCRCADVTNTSKEGRSIDRLDLHDVRKEIERIMSVCLVMDRANALYAMQYDQSSNTDYGMHWVSELHAEQDPSWWKVVPKHSKFPMNRKFVVLLSMNELGLSRRGSELSDIGAWLQPKRRDDSDIDNSAIGS